jgi:hypothetical protein
MFQGSETPPPRIRQTGILTCWAIAAQPYPWVQSHWLQLLLQDCSYARGRQGMIGKWAPAVTRCCRYQRTGARSRTGINCFRLSAKDTKSSVEALPYGLCTQHYAFPLESNQHQHMQNYESKAQGLMQPARMALQGFVMLQRRGPVSDDQCTIMAIHLTSMPRQHL